MDMKMPRLDGFEVTRRIRAHPELKQIPIVAVTGLATPQLQNQALEAGCNRCLAKPIDFALLEEVIQDSIDSCQLH
jgi:CheY-like chemotaxis protein